MTRHLWLSLALVSLSACDTTDTPNEECQTQHTTWRFTENGQLIAQGTFAQIIPDVNGGHVAGSFMIEGANSNVTCNFLQMSEPNPGVLKEGLLDNFTCIATTPEGVTPQWIAAILESEGLDLRPTLSQLNVEGDYTSGTITGTMSRIDTLDFTPPYTIVSQLVDFDFTFKAVKFPGSGSDGTCDPSPSPEEPIGCTRPVLVQACSMNGCSVNDTTCSNRDNSASITIPEGLTSGETCSKVGDFIREWCMSDL